MAQNKKNELDTTYQTNLKANANTPNVQPTQEIKPVTLDTTYQGNAEALYGGHNGSWWQEQYSSQSNDVTRNMIKKAADYYGYKIDESLVNNQNLSFGDRFKNAISAGVTYANYISDKAASSKSAAATTLGENNNNSKVVTYASNQSQTQESNNATPVATNSEPVDSYEEFLRKRAEGYQENYDKQIQAIEEQKQQAQEMAELQRQQTEQNAENERQRNIIDARSSYEQNKATAGANAEALESMGLNQSGYSDYLESKAYATQRAETQSANANAEAIKQDAKYIADSNKLEIEQNASQNKLDAEMTYAENMLNNDAAIVQYKEQQEKEKKAAYSELLSYANNGAYTKEQLESLGYKYGLSEEDITSLGDAAIKYQEKQDKEKLEKKAEDIRSYYTALLDSANSGEYSAEQLASLGAEYGLSDSQIEDLKTAANTYIVNKQDKNFKELMSKVDMEGFDSIKSALKNGDISQEQYDTIVAKYQSNYYESYSSIIESDFGSANTAEIDRALKSGYITQEHYNSLKTKYNAGVSSAISAASLFYLNGSLVDESTAKAVKEKLFSTGWLTDDNKNKINSLYDSAFTKKDDGDDGGGGCYTGDTLITMADGTQKTVDKLLVGDNVLVFNHETGSLDSSPVSYIYYDSEKEYDVLKLRFDNESEVNVVYGHGFFDIVLNKYVLINSDNVKDYIGHKFYYISQENNEFNKQEVCLVGYETYKENTECYSVITANHFNSVSNGILTITDDGNRPAGLLKGFYNVFDLDDNHQYIKESMQEDINKYGLLPYESLKDCVSEEIFNAFNGSYLGVAIGKGLVTLDEVKGYIEKFL